MRILDLSAGNRAIWFDKEPSDCVFVDRREVVRPSVVADTRALPFNGPFDLIVFDPPHVNFGANGHMTKRYGHHTTEEIRDIVRGSAKEAHRVASAEGLLAFKWNNHDQSFARVLGLMAGWWKPLFGTTTAKRNNTNSSTQWIMLRRV